MLLLLFLLFLIPIGVYCLILAGINRRPHPLVVSGTWDCIGLLLAASGFLLGAAPGILAVLYAKLLQQLPLEEPRSGAEALNVLLTHWWGSVLLYYGIMIAGSAALVYSRRNKTVVYNIHPADWEPVFAQVLAKFGLEQTRAGKRLAVVRAPLEHALVSSIAAGPPSESAVELAPQNREALAHVEIFPALCNVTLHWTESSTDMGAEIQRELAARLGYVQTGDNPAAGWFLSIGGGIITMVGLTVLVLFFLSIVRRW